MFKPTAREVILRSKKIAPPGENLEGIEEVNKINQYFPIIKFLIDIIIKKTLIK